MFCFRKKSEDVIFTESHAVEIGGEYVGSIGVGKSGKYSLKLVPSYGYLALTECRLEKLLAKVKELNKNVPVSR